MVEVVLVQVKMMKIVFFLQIMTKLVVEEVAVAVDFLQDLVDQEEVVAVLRMVQQVV